MLVAIGLDAGSIAHFMYGEDEIVTSLAVLAELENGDFPGKTQAIDLISKLSVEDVTEAVIEIAEAYIAH